MLVLLSPAKKQDYDSPAPTLETSQPEFKAQIAELVSHCKQLGPAGLKQLMGISDTLAQLNAQRFEHFDPGHYSLDNAKQALFAFQGDVYKGLDAASFTSEDIHFAHGHLIMLSGLYGLLRPLDLMQPYRLEMGIKLKNAKGNTLYEYWNTQLTEALNHRTKSLKDPVVVNLASKEYSQAIHPDKLDAKWLDIDFKEKKGSDYKIVGLHAKRARGLMARHIVKHQIRDINKLKHFGEGGYGFNEKLSQPGHWVFVR